MASEPSLHLSQKVQGLAADCPIIYYWSSRQFKEFFRRTLPSWATNNLWASRDTTSPPRFVIIEDNMGDGKVV